MLDMPQAASGIHACGFDWMTCTNSNTAKQKLMLDMLTYAWDHTTTTTIVPDTTEQLHLRCYSDKFVQRQSSDCVILLIANDDEYAYALSKLKQRGVTTIVIHDFTPYPDENHRLPESSASLFGTSAISSPLLNIADVGISIHEIISETLSCHVDIQPRKQQQDKLEMKAVPFSTTKLAPSTSTTNESTSDDAGTPIANETECRENPKQRDEVFVENRNPNFIPQNPDHVLHLCQTVKQVWQQNQSNDGGTVIVEGCGGGNSASANRFGTGWVWLAQVADCLQQTIQKTMKQSITVPPTPGEDVHNACKAMARTARIEAETRDFIEVGRRSLSSSKDKKKRVIVSSKTHQAKRIYRMKCMFVSRQKEKNFFKVMEQTKPHPMEE
jgi:hypothetical protein